MQSCRLCWLSDTFDERGKDITPSSRLSQNKRFPTTSGDIDHNMDELFFLLPRELLTSLSDEDMRNL